MRITQSQKKAVIALLSSRFGTGSRVWLFGSRVDDERRGGDVDLYVEAASSPEDPVMAGVRATMALEDLFDGAGVDLLLRYPQEEAQPIQAIARKTGVLL